MQPVALDEGVESEGRARLRLKPAAMTAIQMSGGVTLIAPVRQQAQAPSHKLPASSPSALNARRLSCAYSCKDRPVPGILEVLFVVFAPLNVTWMRSR